ncbi:MAG: YeeE/YedE family protein [Desulfobacterales bacterium]|nr:YeeE/YedE family protein [Desulfobacterales bacterium]
MNELIYGLVTGIIFGFLLQKGRVIRYDKQIGALLLKDMTIVKFMLTHDPRGHGGSLPACGSGIGKAFPQGDDPGGKYCRRPDLRIGWGLLGYCPGTQMGALGEGRWDALWGILGMLAGAALFAEAYPALKATGPDLGRFRQDYDAADPGINHVRHCGHGCAGLAPVSVV